MLGKNSKTILIALAIGQLGSISTFVQAANTPESGTVYGGYKSKHMPNANSKYGWTIAQELGPDGISSTGESQDKRISIGVESNYEDKTLGYDKFTDTTITNATGGVNASISVGSGTYKRQIKNVENGIDSYDAVNVAQLKAAVSQATNSTSVANGDNTTVTGSGSTSNPYRVTANTDDTTITTVNNKLAVKTTPLTASINGTVSSGDTTSLVTGNSVAQAINNAGFTLTTGGNTTTKDISQLVKAGNTVTIAGGTNISVTQDAGTITVNTADNVVTKATDKYVTGGTATYKTDGTGTATLTGTNGVNATITGLKDTKVTGGSVTGSTLTLTTNDGKTVPGIDLSNVNTDSHLVANPTEGSDGKYTADVNGNVTLKVVDKNGANATDVVIADVASKTAVDKNTTNITNLTNTVNGGLNFTGDDGSTAVNKKLGGTLTIAGGATGEVTDNNISVKADGNKIDIKLAKQLDLTETGSVTTGATTVNNSGVTIANADPAKNVSVTTDGLNNGGNKITNVKAGTDETDAVNFGQLNQAITGVNNKTFGVKADDGKTVTEKLDGTIDIAGDGKNIATTVEGRKLQIGLKDNLSIGEKTADGKDGKDGSIAVNGKDGSAVVINGKDGSIGLNGANGLTIKGANGKDGLDGKNGDKGMTRIVYETPNLTNPNGKPVTHEVATMEDGLKFVGNDGQVVAKKLNETLSITGDAAPDNLSDGKNIGVVKDKDGLKIKLSNDITVKTVTTTDDKGNTTITNGSGVTTVDKDHNNTELTSTGITITDKDGNTVSLTNNGLNNGGKTITNVASGIVNRDVNDNTNAANIGDVKQIANQVAEETVNNKTFGVKADDGKTVTKKLDSTIDIAGDGKNITTTVQGDKLQIGLKDNLSIGEKAADGKDGKDGSFGVNGKDGSAVVINGKDGSIGLNGKDGENGLTIKGAKRQDGVDGKNGTDGMTRIVYETPNPTNPNGTPDTHEVATMDDGLKFVGDDGNVVNKKLNETLNIKGGATKDQVSNNNNVGVINNNGTLEVKLNKNIDLGTDGSVKTGNTTINNNGVSITDGPSVTKDGINAGDKIISGVATGVKDTDAVNVKQLKDASGWNLVTDSGDSAKSRVGLDNNTFTINGDNKNISVTNTGNTATVKLNNQLVIGDNPNGHPVVIDGDSGQIGNLSNTHLTPNTGVGGRESIAATEGQLREMGGNVDRAINGLKGDIADAGANASAMAALKPMQYDPMEPTQIMAGVGGYKGSHALAIGVAHYTNESTLFHAGVSVGAHNNMYNAGVTWKFGNRDEEQAIPDRYKAGPISSVYVMQDEMSAVKAQNQQLVAENKAQKDEIEQMKATIQALVNKVGL